MAVERVTDEVAVEEDQLFYKFGIGQKESEEPLSCAIGEVK